jgi:hypothetical protein
MKNESLEAKIIALEAQAKNQENKLRMFEDIAAIERLQRAYGYYLEHWMSEEVIDCFSDAPDVALKLYEGTYVGKASLRRYFYRDENPENMLQVMQISGIVDVAPDGQTAQGRWYSWGACATPQGGGIYQYYMNGIYENEYVKENGKWKIKILYYNLNYSALPATGWVKPERVAAMDPKSKYFAPKPDLPPDSFDVKYPSGYIFPFHYKHPVTGKETTERARNAALKGQASKKE